MREALLECAIDHFVRFGFEGAATRAIAADCGTAMSSITYHFGGKEGLYLAAAEHIANQIKQFHGAALAETLAQMPISKDAAIARLIALLDDFAVMMLDERSARWARFITREQQEPTEAFARIYPVAMQPVVETFIRLVTVARPDLSAREHSACAFLLLGQAIELRSSRASLERLLETSAIGPDDQRLMRARLAAHARAILNAPPESSR